MSSLLNAKNLHPHGDFSVFLIYGATVGEVTVLGRSGFSREYSSMTTIIIHLSHI